MDIFEFRANLIAYFEENYDSYTVKPCEVLKNNGVTLIGLAINDGTTKVCLTVYLEQLFEEYKSHHSLEKISETIISYNEKHRYKGDFNPEYFSDFDRIKDSIYIKLINTGQNEELLKTVPNRSFLDLSIVVYCDVTSVCGVGATILVKNDHIKNWDVSSNDIIDIAFENTRNKEIFIKDIRDVLSEKRLAQKESIDSDMMYVMYSDELMFAAASMIFSDKLDELIGDNSNGIYILPSSIYEVMIVPYKEEFETDHINSVIGEVNKYTLEDVEVLSSHAYFYSKEKGYAIV